MAPVIELTPTSMAHGGEALARLDGKAHFVAGVIPGEKVTASIIDDRTSWARARLVAILEASKDRVEPPCPAFGACGGCAWQYAAGEAQRRWKRDILAGQLAHLGGIADPPVDDTIAPSGAYAYRNRMDFRVLEGRPALHRRRSHELVDLDQCLLLRPELASVFAALGNLDGATGVTLRMGEGSGETMAIVGGTVPEAARQWPVDSLVRRSGGRLVAVRGRTWYEEVVGTTRFRVPGDAFFQISTAGAEVLVSLVGDALSAAPGDVLLDGYAGVGLFAATIGSDVARVVAVESSPAASKACSRNLSRKRGNRADLVIRHRFESAFLHETVDIAVIDPPRSGLRSSGVAALVAAAPRAVAYVSCDPASLARDAALLWQHGYRLDRVTPVDVFPQTHHIEAVARFVPT